MACVCPAHTTPSPHALLHINICSAKLKVSRGQAQHARTHTYQNLHTVQKPSLSRSGAIAKGRLALFRNGWLPSGAALKAGMVLLTSSVSLPTKATSVKPTSRQNCDRWHTQASGLAMHLCAQKVDQPCT